MGIKEKNSYSQFCPVARAAEIFTTRWTPIVLRELIAGSTKFNDLRRGVPRMSPSLLSKRLVELEESGILIRKKLKKGRGYEYELSEIGKELAPLVMSLGQWGQKYIVTEFANHELDPSLLMWDIQRRVNFRAFPRQKNICAHFYIEGAPLQRRNWWIVFADGERDLCLQEPEFLLVDLAISTNLRGLTDIWMGKMSLELALQRKTIKLHGKKEFISSFKEWFTLSVFAGQLN